MTSVHPAWEETVAFVVGEEMYPFQILAPETGVSLNEVCTCLRHIIIVKLTFQGVIYRKQLEICSMGKKL